MKGKTKFHSGIFQTADRVSIQNSVSTHVVLPCDRTFSAANKTLSTSYRVLFTAQMTFYAVEITLFAVEKVLSAGPKAPFAGPKFSWPAKSINHQPKGDVMPPQRFRVDVHVVGE
jgi:hypothetical protein